MKVKGRFLAIILFFPIAGFAQQKDTLVKKLDSLSIKADNSGKEPVNTKPATYNEAKLDFQTYFTLLGDDFKQQVTQPLHTTKKDWAKVGAFALLTGAVSLANRPVNRFAVKLHDENKTVAKISRYVTDFGGAYEVYAIAGFYAYGLIFKTQKEKTTTALATQAYITAGVLSTAFKFLAGEQRPYYTDPNFNKTGPVFHGPLYPFTKGVDSHGYSSFPSGHTTAAFSAATVYALEYKDKPLIPIISYSAATLIGLSRLTENAHWPTDILVGAALGYLSGRQVVNNFHRYSNLKRGVAHHQSLLFNLQYQNKQVLTGMTYNF